MELRARLVFPYDIFRGPIVIQRFREFPCFLQIPARRDRQHLAVFHLSQNVVGPGHILDFLGSDRLAVREVSGGDGNHAPL